MARPRKQTIDEQLKKAQADYIEARKRCDELAKEITRLSQLKKEEMTKQLLDAMTNSNKSFEEVLAFINEGINDQEED